MARNCPARSGGRRGAGYRPVGGVGGPTAAETTSAAQPPASREPDGAVPPERRPPRGRVRPARVHPAPHQLLRDIGVLGGVPARRRDVTPGED
jgi:hypothetical protein